MDTFLNCPVELTLERVRLTIPSERLRHRSYRDWKGRRSLGQSVNTTLACPCKGTPLDRRENQTNLAGTLLSAGKHGLSETSDLAAVLEVTGDFCTSGSEREFTLEESWARDCVRFHTHMIQSSARRLCQTRL